MRLHPEPYTFATIAQAFLDGKLETNFIQKQHTKYSFLFSNENVFRLDKEGLCVVEFPDSKEELSVFNLKAHSFLVDKSSYIYNTFSGTKLPLEVDERNYDLYSYKVSLRSPVTLYIVKEETGIITEIWFELHESLISNPSISEDINTFLTL